MTTLKSKTTLMRFGVRMQLEHNLLEEICAQIDDKIESWLAILPEDTGVGDSIEERMAFIKNIFHKVRSGQACKEIVESVFSKYIHEAS